MGDDIPNSKSAARSKHRGGHPKDKPAKYRSKIENPRSSAENKTQKPKIDLKTTVLNISTAELEEFGQRGLTSNWNKYEELAAPEDNEQLSASDFSELLQMPTGGGHFQFAAEKNWQQSTSQEDDKKFSKYFNLDTRILNCGLSTIPFYEQQRYDKSLFTQEEINRMNMKAEINEKLYEKLVHNKPKEQPKAPEYVSNIINALKTSPNSTVEAKIDATKPLSREVLTNLENSVTSIAISTSTTQVLPTAASEKADIQQWLDDILDD